MRADSLTARRAKLAATSTAVALAVCALAAGVAGAAASTGRATIPLTGRVIQLDNKYTINGNPACSEKWILLIDVPADVVSYRASVNQPGLEVFQFSGPPFTSPITGYGKPYEVPPGKAGWFLGGDSGGGPCAPSSPGKYDHLHATGTIETVSAPVAKVGPAPGSVGFTFKPNGPTAYLQCALVRRPPKGGKLPKPRYRRCRSPRIYRLLRPGRYTFRVRASMPGATGLATSVTVTIS